MHVLSQTEKYAKLFAGIAVLAVLFLSRAVAQEGVVTTRSTTGGNSAFIVQNGDPSSASTTVQRKPGFVRVEQHSQGNSAVIIQSDDPAPRNGASGGNSR